MNNSNNFNENTMDKIKNLVDNGNISDAISQISPEMINQFSSMMANLNTNSDTSQSSSANMQNSNNSYNNFQNNYTNSQGRNSSQNTSGNTANSTAQLNQALNGIDINTIMKMSSAFGKMNNSNDPRANLLNSLKPYLRDTKKDKLDNYVNLLNMTKIADVLKNNPNFNPNKEQS